MICKGNFDGTLYEECSGDSEQFKFIGYCVVICEDENEWGVLREALHYRLLFLKKISISGHPLLDYSEDIKMLERMYKETE